MHNMKLIKLVAVMLPLLALSACGDNPPTSAELKATMQNLSYVYGNVSTVDVVYCLKLEEDNQSDYACSFKINGGQERSGCFAKSGSQWISMPPC